MKRTVSYTQKGKALIVMGSPNFVTNGRSIWDKTKFIECRFHLAQAWLRIIKKCGLVHEYKDTNSEIAMFTLRF